MRITITILFLLLHAITYGQKIRFTDTVNSWKIKLSAGQPAFSNYQLRYYDGTVTQKGFDYTNIKNLGLCREDTLLNKVYIIKPGDTVEKLLYDYNLQVGDTLVYHFFSLPHNAAGVVAKKDSILIAGNYYKKWELNNLAPYIYTTTILEGIGVLVWGTFEQGKETVCFKRDEIMIPVDYYITSFSCALDVNNINTNNKAVTISPNPANQYSNINFPYTIQAGTLTITDILGRKLVSKSIFNQTAIPIGELPAAGVYFYTITDNNNNQSFTGKFIYE
ncbi:MAG: T9SS type A sorting domain-containing protein [Flavipsychrobacter sp.]|nr:T9SS type A sorting domain-containing protein [Flavipsychrobacter sp.]